jgi:hypothetical protein
MVSATATQVLTATRRWLKPVVYVLLRSGITWREFCELAKTTYVDVATAHFGTRGRPTNVSRTSMLTGMTRRDVRLLRERREPESSPPTPYASKASRVLSAWHLEPAFLDATGRPALLPLAGEGTSFTELLRHCGAGDVRPSTVIRELLRAGAIRRHKDGRVEALQRNYIPQATDEQLIRLWGTVLADIANTYVHNMSRGPRPPRFERAAKSDRIPIGAAPAFREFLEREGQGFLERVDAWLLANELQDGDADIQTTRMGAGVYHIED